MTPQSIIPFAYGDHLVRTILLEDRPWFVAKDVCGILGLENPTRALASLEETEEKITLTNSDGNPRAGIPHQLTYVNEPGLYRLIFKSRKAEARAFQHWVFHEVLPTLRRTGRYETSARAEQEPRADLPEPSSHFLRLIREQIQMGVSPDIASRIAGRIILAQDFEAPAKIEGPSPTSHLPRGSRMTPADELIRSMEEGRYYTLDELLAMLPPDHPILSRKPGRGQLSALGRLFRTYAEAGRVYRCHDKGRSTFARRPATVVDFKTAP